MTLEAEQPLELARGYFETGDLPRAEAACRKLLRDDPRDAPAVHLFGLVALEMGDRQAACDILSRAAALAPQDPTVLTDLARALVRENQLEKASAACAAALRLRSDYAPAHFEFGNALRDRDLLEEAVTAYRAAISCKRDFIDAYGILGRTLTMLGRFNEALAVVRQAVQSFPGSADAVSDMGTVLKDQGKYSAALQAYGNALAIDPAHADAHSRRATILLQSGEFAQGWEEYEWRMRSRQFPSARRGYVPPTWTGRDLNNRKLLLHPEQGIGDTIQFLRYVRLIASAGGQAYIHSPPPLAPLLKSSFGTALALIEETSPPPPSFDFECPIMTLPRVFRTELNTIPAPIPYIKPDPALEAQWGQRVGPADGRLRVGLVWAGSLTHRQNRQRSISLATFAPLANVPGIQLFNLQKGPAAAQMAKPAEMKLVDLMPQVQDLADTAALISQLDLVIAVDTAVAHLAGAMGKPVWLLVHFVSEWRWMLDRDDSPWYPTMALFRQKQYGDWNEVMRRVAGRLPEFHKQPTAVRAQAEAPGRPKSPFSDVEIR